MSEETAHKTPGVFLPSWWLAILLVPGAYGIWSAGQSLTRIETKVDGIENRITAVERDTKLNDERWRQTQIDVGAAKAAAETVAKMSAAQKEN